MKQYYPVIILVSIILFSLTLMNILFSLSVLNSNIKDLSDRINGNGVSIDSINNKLKEQHEK